MNTVSHSAIRIWGLALRHYFLIKGSWPRILELVYWPALQMTLWGFITIFFETHSSWLAQAGGILITAILLWDIMFRSQLSFFLSFLEEIWSRNLGHIFVSPIRPFEIIAALLMVSLIRTLVGVGAAALLAILIFDVSIFSLGAPLALFFLNLTLMGWSLGLVVSALVLRFGQGAESLGWAAIFLLQPISGVFYPINVLPEWLQPVAFLIPVSHIFEGLRSILIEQTFRADLLLNAFSLNLVFVLLSLTVFFVILRYARIHGQLLQMGE
ncbi:MAG: ABC transporter [Rhodospirillaceae bacterium]|nr:ABC transporter [Rhodospirillaceae bacterium]